MSDRLTLRCGTVYSQDGYYPNGDFRIGAGYALDSQSFDFVLRKTVDVTKTLTGALAYTVRI